MLLVLALTAIAALPRLQVSAPPARADLWIDVVALDDHAAPVTDLRPNEFEVWIGGYRIPITDVIAVTPEDRESRTIVVILDNMAVPPMLLPRVKEAARLLVEKTSPGDRVSIVPLHGGVMESTNDRTRLLRAIDGYSVEGFPFQIDDAAEHVLKTFTSLSYQLSEAPGRRKTIVAIGAGWMFDNPFPPPDVRDLSADWIAAERAMAATHTSVYVIDPAGLGVGPGPAVSGDSGLAHATGGYAFRNTNDIRGAVERIWRETSSYYLLGVIDPPVRRTADLRKLEVKVLRKGVAARARRGIKGRP